MRQWLGNLQVFAYILRLGIKMVKSLDIECLKSSNHQIECIYSKFRIKLARLDMRNQLGNLTLFDCMFHHYINSLCSQFLCSL